MFEKSGFYEHDDLWNENFLITQGLSGYTFVAQKSTLIRGFMWQAASTSGSSIIDRMVFSIDNKFIETVPRASLKFESNPTLGPSLSLVIPGKWWLLGPHFYKMSFQNVNGQEQWSLSVTVKCLPTKDLRFMVIPIQGTKRHFLPTQEWYDDIHRSMLRLGSLFPVRDGVIQDLDHSNPAGIRYQIGAAMEAWPEEVGIHTIDYCGQTKQINSRHGNVDVTILYRPHQVGEDVGGISVIGGCPTRGCNCVSGKLGNGLGVTAACFAQETGHNFGLEPPGSPHFQDPQDHGHSKDAKIDNSDGYAYDFVNSRYYKDNLPHGGFLGDTLNNTGGGAFQGSDSILFNSYDWEHLRQEIMKISDNYTGVF